MDSKLSSRCGKPVESEKNDTKFTWKWFIEECGHFPVFVMYSFFWVGGGGGNPNQQATCYVDFAKVHILLCIIN